MMILSRTDSTWRSFVVLVDREFLEERRRALKRYLQNLCRHPIICEKDMIKFFLTYQGEVRTHTLIDTLCTRRLVMRG